MVENTNNVLIVDRFVITGASAEALEAASELFTWDKQTLIDYLTVMHDPDNDAEFAVELAPQNPDSRSFIGVRVVIDPKDILNLDAIDPYEWTPVEVFAKLCKKNPVYSYKDTLFDQWGGKRSGAFTGCIERYALGFFGYDHDDENISYCPYIKASSSKNFKPIYCKLIKY